MRIFWIVLLTACATTRNEPPIAAATPPANPVAAFLSPSLRTVLSGDGVTTTLTLRMASGRVAFGVIKDVVASGVTHPMQMLTLPEDTLDIAELEGVLCALKNNATVTCAALDGSKQPEKIAVDADARRLFLLAEDKRCVLRATGNWRCYTRQFDHPWTVDEYTGKTLEQNGLGEAPVPDSRCFITRDAKLLCLDEEALGARDSMEGVVAASAGRGSGDFSGGCAVRKGGDVACWTQGINETGVLGNGARGPASGPQAVRGVHDATAVSFEPDHACALTRGGDVLCWGSADGYAFGEAAYDAAKKYRVCGEGESPGGNDCMTASPLDKSPHQRLVLVARVVPELHGVKSIAVGHERTCGVRGDGRILCLGGGYPGAWTPSRS